MKKILLIPALLGVAVASGVVSSKFLTAGSVNPAKSGTKSAPGQTSKAASAGEWSATEAKSSANGVAKHPSATGTGSSRQSPSSAKRLLSSLKNRSGSPNSQPSHASTAGPSQSAASAAGAATGAGATSPGYPGGGSSSTAGGASGTSGGTSGGTGSSNTGAASQQGAAGAAVPEAAAEIVMTVPAGAMVPAALKDNELRTPQQQKALDQIAVEFEANVSNPPPGVTETENWETARQIADSRYLTLYGYQAYNQYHIEAAKEAVKEKKAVAP